MISSPSRRFRRSRQPFRAAMGSLVLLLVLANGLPVSAAEDHHLAAEPRRLIEETTNRIVLILSQKDVSEETKIQQIEEVAYDVFDFTTMSKLVLARRWRKLSRDQKGEFVREFKRSLSATYGTRLRRYDQEEVEIYGTQIEPRDDVSVRTRIVGGQYAGAKLSYRLRKRNDRWRIIDVVIEGVSLVSNYRSQFSEILNRGTIEDLLGKLRDKNFKVEDGA
jgi:phospholipid transport system substrate-binding protein